MRDDLHLSVFLYISTFSTQSDATAETQTPFTLSHTELCMCSLYSIRALERQKNQRQEEGEAAGCVCILYVYIKTQREK